MGRRRPNRRQEGGGGVDQAVSRQAHPGTGTHAPSHALAPTIRTRTQSAGTPVDARRTGLQRSRARVLACAGARAHPARGATAPRLLLLLFAAYTPWSIRARRWVRVHSRKSVSGNLGARYELASSPRSAPLLARTQNGGPRQAAGLWLLQLGSPAHRRRIHHNLPVVCSPA